MPPTIEMQETDDGWFRWPRYRTGGPETFATYLHAHLDTYADYTRRESPDGTVLAARVYAANDWEDGRYRQHDISVDNDGTIRTRPAVCREGAVLIDHKATMVSVLEPVRQQFLDHIDQVEDAPVIEQLL